MMRTLAIAAVLLAAPAARADVQLWSEAGVRAQLAKRTQLTFDQHLRFDADVSRVQSVMPEAGLHHRFEKWLRAGIGYRLEYERDGTELVARHRGHIYGRARYKLGAFQLVYKLQYQESIRPDKNKLLKHVVRNRIELGYRATKRLEPAIGAEMFHRLGDETTARYERIWLTAGVTYARKRWDADVFYRLEISGDAMTPDAHIIGLGFHSDMPGMK